MAYPKAYNLLKIYSLEFLIHHFSTKQNREQAKASIDHVLAKTAAEQSL